MQYSHKRSNIAVRIIYICLIVCGFIFYNIGDGILKTSMSFLSIVSLVAGLYLFLRSEMTTYTLVVNERDTDFDFFVNKANGKKGNYVCYFYVSDAIKIVQYSKEAVNELTKEYKNVGYYSFCHNLISNDKYIILFKSSDHYDMIVVEMNEEFKAYFESCMSTAIPCEKQSLHNEE